MNGEGMKMKKTKANGKETKKKDGGMKLRIQTLGKGWNDKDVVLTHACFQCLVDFMEKEKPEESVVWTYSPETAHAWKELNYLYQWWKQITTSPAPALSEQEQTALETKNLKRLVNVRGYMWT